jgi:hypothetical protein
LTDIPPSATPANIGLGTSLRLAGYTIQPPTLQIDPASSEDSPTGEAFQPSSAPTLILYWHALTPLSVNYTISVRARAIGDRLLAQQDSWPINGLLPTTLWRQGDYVTDVHTLEIPSAERTQIDHFEVVVYDAATGETLGPLITLPDDSKQ